MICLLSFLQLLLLRTRFTLFCFDFLYDLLDRLYGNKLWLAKAAMVCESRSDMIINESPVLRLFNRLWLLFSLNDLLRLLRRTLDWQ
jgi:hypothetical protein